MAFQFNQKQNQINQPAQTNFGQNQFQQPDINNNQPQGFTAVQPPPQNYGFQMKPQIQPTGFAMSQPQANSLQPALGFNQPLAPTNNFGNQPNTFNANQPINAVQNNTFGAPQNQPLQQPEEIKYSDQVQTSGNVTQNLLIDIFSQINSNLKTYQKVQKFIDNIYPLQQNQIKEQINQLQNNINQLSVHQQSFDIQLQDASVQHKLQKSVALQNSDQFYQQYIIDNIMKQLDQQITKFTNQQNNNQINQLQYLSKCVVPANILNVIQAQILKIQQIGKVIDQK